MGEKFQTTLTCSNGQTMIVRFDLSTTGKPEGLFDTEKVIKHFRDAILADEEKEYGEFLSIAATIADVLNEKMSQVGSEVMAHVAAANRIISYLGMRNMTNAYLGAVQLAQDLQVYSPASDQVWAIWLREVVTYAEGEIGGNSVGFGENVFDPF